MPTTTSIQRWEDDLSALRMLMAGDEFFAPASRKQLGVLNSLLGQALCDPANRIPTIAYITNIPKLTSTKQLTAHTASVLIDYLLAEEEGWHVSEQGKGLVRYCEKRVEIAALLRAGQTYFDWLSP